MAGPSRTSSLPAARAFAGPEAFASWLEHNHETAAELLVCCFKTHAADRGLTYRQALEEALCFGWIDGVRRSIDAHRFSVRFTPRKPKSRWSAVNVKLATTLEAAGRLRPAGRAAFEARSAQTPAGYSYESRVVELAPAYLREFRANRQAWAFFGKQPPWYRRTSSFWVMSAKQEETRRRRLAQLIARSAQEAPIGPLARPGHGKDKAASGKGR